MKETGMQPSEKRSDGLLKIEIRVAETETVMEEAKLVI
jgi:hypothetical protein